ncbi:MAG: NEAT domain-containing protein, partial [Peptostreptococcaceae bacterium]
ISSIIKVNALESADLESGIYEVQNDVHHESELGVSMSRSYLNETAQIEVSKGKVYFTLEFTGTNYMKDYRILIDGQNTGIDIIEEDEENQSIKLKFPVDSLEPNIQAKIYVEPMERDVEFDIITKIDTLKLVEKI